MRANILTTLLCLTCAVAPGKSHRGRPPEQILVEYKTAQATFSLHEPVVVTFSVHNSLSQPIALKLGAQNRQFFDFSLTTPLGAVLEGSFLPKGEVPNIVTFGTGEVLVPPDADYSQPLVMNQWFDFSREGTYLLTAKLSNDINVSGDGSIPGGSQEVRIQIGPRDPARLEQLCARLTAEVEQAPTVDAARIAALELSYVDDAVAVQYLGQALLVKAGSFDSLLVPALEKVGNTQSVEVLLSALSSTSGDVSDQAERALRNMQGKIADPALKARVAAALAQKAASRESAHSR